MAITVSELVAIPSLGTRLVAGAGRADRVISWAHVCELDEPWSWLGDGELLMTTGIGIPSAVPAQVRYVEESAAAGLAGVVIGDRMRAPPLTDRMLATADRLGLPVLLTQPEVPFIALARTVAGANAREEQARLALTEQIYNRLRSLTAGGEIGALLAPLSADLGQRLVVVDGLTRHDAGGSALLSEDPEVSALIALAAGHPKHPRPAVMRLDPGSGAVALALPPPRPAVLLAIPRSSRHPDVGLLHHVAAVIAVHRSISAADRERARRLGSALFARIIDDAIDPAVALDELLERGLGVTRVVAVASQTEDSDEWGDLHHHLDVQGIGHLLLTRGGIAMAMLPDQEDALTTFVSALPATARVGISEPYDRVADTRPALLQARWALHQTQAASVRVSRYAPVEGSSGFLPASLPDSERAASRVLGPLLAYDKEKHSQLVPSLRVFLEENRSWQRAASRLHVHKQTLVYRIERIEQLTGRQLNSTADVADLWLAIQAAMACGLLAI